MQPELVLWACALCSHLGPQAEKGPVLGLSLCCHHLETPKSFIFAFVFAKASGTLEHARGYSRHAHMQRLLLFLPAPLAYHVHDAP